METSLLDLMNNKRLNTMRPLHNYRILSFRPTGEIFNSSNITRFLVAAAPRNDIMRRSRDIKAAKINQRKSDGNKKGRITALSLDPANPVQTC
jgi:hypothetical protein